MSVQTIFKTGNSYVVTIPREIRRELNLRLGSKITVGTTQDNQAIIIQKQSKKTKPSQSKKEFKKWLDKTLKEDKDLLHELSLR